MKVTTFKIPVHVLPIKSSAQMNKSAQPVFGR